MDNGRVVWDQVLAAAQAVHREHPALSAFCPFPGDLRSQAVTAFSVPAASAMIADTGLFGTGYEALRHGFVAASPFAQWRETYKGTDIGQDFMDRFACYCLIGEGGAFHSDQMWSWVIYMPPGLHYRWHHHPAEEMYLTLGGEATFMRKGHPDRVLRAGDSSQHDSNQPHAMETGAHPVMAYVVWRNGFETAPMLTAAE